ncbi:MAG: DUF6671 family protein [Xanthobacteraceae bacterium]
MLATMHGKEVAIAPALRERLGLIVEVAEGIDTDRLGTFTGEIPRAGTIEEAAIAKARLGMAVADARIGVASEGSYGPHPQIPFIGAGFELMVLVDDERKIVVREHLIDETPVYSHTVAATDSELNAFLQSISFPAHALILRPNAPRDGDTTLHKGVRTREELGRTLQDCAERSGDGRVFIQTDMRAHMNPTRMDAIGRLAKRFADRLVCLCPACRTPGYGLIAVEKGLPCNWCGGPTLMVRHQIFGCVSCENKEKRERSDGLAEADPGQCTNCNP